MIIKMKPKKACDLPFLTRLVLRFVYEEHKMSIHEIELMMKSINRWAQMIIDEKEKRKARFIILPGELENDTTEEEKHLEALGKLLQRKQSKEPKLMQRIAMVKEGLLNWQKFHRLPEAYSKEDTTKAQILYKKYCEENPEQEGIV